VRSGRGSKVEGTEKVNREVKVVEGLMLNLVKDGMAVSEIN
jgi:hypothetical protein